MKNKELSSLAVNGGYLTKRQIAILEQQKEEQTESQKSENAEIKENGKEGNNESSKI